MGLTITQAYLADGAIIGDARNNAEHTTRVSYNVEVYCFDVSDLVSSFSRFTDLETVLGRAMSPRSPVISTARNAPHSCSASTNGCNPG